MIKLKDILLSEKAVSKQQQKFFGVVKAMQKGDIPKKGEAGKIAKDMSKKDVDDFAGTKHKGLPNKVDEELLDEKGTRCWKGYKKKGMKTMFGKRVPNCVKNEAELEKEKFTTTDQMRMYEDEVDEGSLPIKLKDVLAVKKMELSKDAPESVKDFWMHHHYDGTTAGPAEPDTYDFDDDMQSDPGWQLDDPDEEEGGYEPVDENLRQWFGKGGKGSASGGGWDRYNTKGEKIGKCGDRKKGEGKPKCLSKDKARKLRAKGGKKAIANAVKRKRREDGDKDRRGKAKNVSNKPKKRSKRGKRK